MNCNWCGCASRDVRGGGPGDLDGRDSIDGSGRGFNGGADVTHGRVVVVDLRLVRSLGLDCVRASIDASGNSIRRARGCEGIKGRWSGVDVPSCGVGVHLQVLVVAKHLAQCMLVIR